MTQLVRLSEVSEQASKALSELDEDALARLRVKLGEILAGRAGIEPQPCEEIERTQRVLEEVLLATEQSIHLLQRLQHRKVRNEWAL